LDCYLGFFGTTDQGLSTQESDPGK
jgi:hypothetical protein